jgi:hypothetical protein
LQAADVTGQLLHRAKPLMHLFESIAHQLERFAKTPLQRALQFFVYRRPHLVDLICIVLLQLLQPKIDSRPHVFE